jgi:hypothetical protein
VAAIAWRREVAVRIGRAVAADDRRTRIEAGGLKGRELQLHMQAEDAEETRRWQGVERAGPLSRDDVARRDATTEWLTWVADDSRRIVVLALIERAAGRKRTDWARIKRMVGVEAGQQGGVSPLHAGDHGHRQAAQWRLRKADA